MDSTQELTGRVAEAARWPSIPGVQIGLWDLQKIQIVASVALNIFANHFIETTHSLLVASETFLSCSQYI